MRHCRVEFEAVPGVRAQERRGRRVVLGGRGAAAPPGAQERIRISSLRARVSVQWAMAEGGWLRGW
eukprot:4760742-Alexandrium_andersonii.AAC.1